ncbi:MAG: hypothetical protein ABH864_05305 [archaeon]
MEKRGQGPIGIVIGLIVIVFLFGVIAWAFRPSTTGQVVLEDISQDNFVSVPFELRAWVVNIKGIQLDIMNYAEEELFVKSVEVQGCGRTEYGRAMMSGGSELFVVRCNLNEGETFSGAIVINYSPVGGGVEKKAFGNVKDIV